MYLDMNIHYLELSKHLAQMEIPALAKIQPTNDICEGILGLNDWIQKHTPNFNHRIVSGMVETEQRLMRMRPGGGWVHRFG